MNGAHFVGSALILTCINLQLATCIIWCSYDRGTVRTNEVSEGHYVICLFTILTNIRK